MLLTSLLNALPGAVTQGLIWGLMAIGVYITYRILDVADLTVDGSLALGGAACVMLIRGGVNPWLALLIAALCGAAAGFITGTLHTRCGIPAILAGILTQLALYSVNLRIMGGKANQAVSVDKYDLIVSQRFVRQLSLENPMPLLLLVTALLIAALYWFLARRSAAVSAPPVPMPAWRGRRASTPSATWWWVLPSPTASRRSPARSCASIRARRT